MEEVHKDDSSISEYLLGKIHKDDSSDSEYLVEKALPYRMKMSVETVKKRKYEELEETVETDEVPTDRDAIMKNYTYGNSALADNTKDELLLQPATPVAKVTQLPRVMMRWEMSTNLTLRPRTSQPRVGGLTRNL
jgi:hypothetical protein